MDHDPDDLRDVAAWMRCPTNALDLTVAHEPIAPFMSQVREMLASYDLFPHEARRTQRIERGLNTGEPMRPIYIEADDPHRFILEGRHRIVAFHRLGRETVPVCRVRVRKG